MSLVSSSAESGRLRWPLVYLGIGFTTLATLVLELALTRIFSVIFYYHMAFMAISIALFGLGAGGLGSYLLVGRPGNLYRKLGGLASANSLVVVLSMVFLLYGEPGLTGSRLLVVYCASSVPFLLAGAVVSLVISETIDRVDRVYFCDLAGAAAGCLLLIPLLNWVGGPNTVIAAAVLFAISSAIWFSLGRSAVGRVVAVGTGLGLMVLLVYNIKNGMIDVRYAKGKTLTDERFVKWNSFSRIAVTPEPGTRQLSINIDADASTGIPNFDFDRLTPDERASLLSSGPGFPYVLRPAARTLIIGPGGGWDVSRALASGSRDVTGVEINPIIARTIMRDRFPYWSRRLYFRPEVKIHVEDGRSFVRRSREKYQVIQATLVDTWAATAAGAFALSESNLYTTEAFHEYLSHLTEDGLLAFSRWGFEPPRESLRLVTLAMAALTELGEPRPWKHVLVAREGTPEKLAGWGSLDTVIISRKPLGDGDITKARLALRSSGLEGVYVPGDRSGSAFAALLRHPDPQRFLDEYPFDVSPVDDDRPFFFYTVQPRDLWAFLNSWSRDSADWKINRAVPLLFGVLSVSMAATAIVLALPPLLLGSRLPRQRGARRLLAYFAFIGVGYILIQVALIQKFILFLGHPTYALTVIVFSMLVSSGVGSFWSRRLGCFSEGRLSVALATVAVLIALLAIGVPPLIEAAVGWPLWLRMVTSVLLIAPAGFVMGIPFPSGLARLEARHPPSVRWAWSLNAASSVLGSALALFLAIYLGLQQALLAGGACYLCALATVWWTRAAPGHGTLK